MKGRYVLQQPFASGAQAKIFKAFDRFRKQNCLLKTGNSVLDEARLLQNLDHPFILQPYDWGIHPQTGAYAAYSDLIHPSVNLASQQRAFDLKRFALQVAEFLSYLHGRGLLYNDFKPEHFLVDESGIKVIDFGLCSKKEESRDFFAGTFPFVSPESLTGRKLDARSDLFAFGMMLQQLVLPQQMTPLQPDLSALQEIQQRSESLNGFWGAIIRQMTSWEPAQRLGSAYELWK